MTAAFNPRLDILPEPQRALWPEAIDSRFDPATSIRALQFYGDGDLSRVPIKMQLDLTRLAQAVVVAKLPRLPARRGLAPEGLSR